jgi:hypothetical protein
MELMMDTWWYFTAAAENSAENKKGLTIKASKKRFGSFLKKGVLLQTSKMYTNNIKF